MESQNKLQLHFEAGEWDRLQALAHECGMDVGTLLRIAGLALLEAQSRGRFELKRMNATDAMFPRRADEN